VPRPHTSRWYVLALLLAVAATFSEALFTSRGFYERDILGYWYPHIEVLIRTLREGAWPVWDRYVGFGAPLLADPNFSFLYPLTWLNLVVPPEPYFKLLVLTHVVWAALGAWRLARRWGMSDVAGFAAGAAYGLSGVFLASANLFHHFTGASWIPWVLFACERALLIPNMRSALWLGLVAAAQVLAGSGDMCLMSATLCGARLAWHLARAGCWSACGRPLRTLLGGAVLTLLLSAAQWLPTATQVPESARAHADRSSALFWSVHPLSLVDAVVPRLVGGAPLSEPLRHAAFESREPLIKSTYLGVGMVALGLLGFALSGRRGLGLGMSTFFFLIAALGRHAPPYLSLAQVPGFMMMRYPAKFLLPLALCVATLAGLGLDAWHRDWTRRERLAGSSVAVLLAAGAAASIGLTLWMTLAPARIGQWLSPYADPAAATAEAGGRLMHATVVAGTIALLLLWRQRSARVPRGATVCLLIVAIGDLVIAGRAVNGLAPSSLLSLRPQTVDLLRAAGARRIVSMVDSPTCRRIVRHPEGWTVAWTEELGRQARLRPPCGARWGLFGSFDGEFSGLGRAWAGPVSDAALQLRGRPSGLRLLQVAGVTHVVFLGRGDNGGMEQVAELESVFDCPIRILRVPRPLPWVYTVGGERQGGSVAALLDPTFDPRREAIVFAGRNAPASAAFQGQAHVLDERGDVLTAEAELSEPGLLVLLEAFDNGWCATVDGRPTEVLRANVLFRAVRLPAGRHVVRFTYRPASVIWGVVISLFGLTALASLALLLHRKSGLAKPR
jgi:hypothetical protein